MTTQTRPTLTLAMCFAAALIIGGCHESSMTSPAAGQELASTYWKRHNVPNMSQRGYKRIAITDFSVEFVTVRMESPLESQSAFTPPPITPGQHGAVVSGLRRKQISFEPSLCKEVTDEMYDLFVGSLKSRGLEALPREEVTASEAYKRFSTLGTRDSSLTQRINLVGSDTGRTKRVKVYPASGLRIINGARNEDIEDVEADLLLELNADVSLRVHVRVGVFHGHASLERGSTVWVQSRDVIGNLTSDRSLLSEDVVVDEEKFKQLKGQPYIVLGERYHAAIKKLFPSFVAMGLETVTE